MSPKIVTGTCSAVWNILAVGGVRNLASRTTRRGERARQPRQAAGELGVVVGDSLAADQDGIGARAQDVRELRGPPGP